MASVAQGGDIMPTPVIITLIVCVTLVTIVIISRRK